VRIKSIVAAAATLIVIPVALRMIWGRSFDTALGTIAAPALGRLGSLIRSTIVSNTVSSPEEFERLQSEVNRLTVETARLRHLEIENQELRKTLSFVKRVPYSVTPAQVIGHTVDPERRAIIVDFGLAEGATPGLLVATSDGLVLGKISAVRGERSIVVLLTDEESRISVVVERGERVLGLLEGGYGTGMRMRLIPAQSTIETGDLIVTDESDPAIPAGLIVGTVESVRDEEHIPFQVAVIRAAADFETPTIVSIVRPEGDL